MDIPSGLKEAFTAGLMRWHRDENDRDLPWKGEKAPYRIWLSEIILQQTRAAQGIPYYLRFLEHFPGVMEMAAADEDQVFRLWQGLGYYNRCRNMLATARMIASEGDGRFPDTYEKLLGLKGVGPYTAAAIASFAYGLPHAVVDGNVYRVLSRFFGIDIPADTTAGKRFFASLASGLLDTSDSGGYNQAIMDLGAVVCTPAAPRCTICPVAPHCFARQQDAVSLFPVKSRKTQVRTRYFNYLILETKDLIWIQKRTGKDIWQDLHEPYLHETDAPAAEECFPGAWPFGRQAGKPVYKGFSKQKLSHQIIEARFFSAVCKVSFPVPEREGIWVTRDALSRHAFPKTIVSFFEKMGYF